MIICCWTFEQEIIYRNFGDQLVTVRTFFSYVFKGNFIYWYSLSIVCDLCFIRALCEINDGLKDSCLYHLKTRSQSNLTKSASRGAHSLVRGHPRESKVVPLNSWGMVSY